MNAPSYTLTNDSVTVVWEGKTYTARKGTPNFTGLRDALISEDWESVPKNLTVAKSLSAWAKGKFFVEGNVISYDGVVLPNELNNRISEMAARGEDPTPLFNFWEKLQKNPSMRSVQQLWPFLNHRGIPLTKEGNFLAYKGVNPDFTDKHSGQFDNSPGQVHEMPRNQISDDPNEACHIGFHVGALEYAKDFGSRVVVCEVDPADVVCIPYDSSHQKMRVCKYKVVGNHNGQFLPSTTVEDEDVDVESDDDGPDYEDYDGSSSAWEDDAEEESGEEALAKVYTDGAYVGEVKLPKDSTEDLRGVPEGTKKHPDIAKKWTRLHSMGTKELLQESTERLRGYASKGLKIVGASKIPGGKVALIAAIMTVRGEK